MIALLTGNVMDKSLESAVVNAGGVGYEVFMTIPDLASLGPVGKSTTIHIHTYVREEALRLYGFRQRETKTTFTKLIGISGVGPKTALALLSGIDSETLAAAVEQRDIARLSKVPGIGKKTAERICIELKGKLTMLVSAPTTTAETINVDLVSALENLGYRRGRAEEVAQSLDPLVQEGLPLEELVREALSRLQKKP